jgi:hypothetical protein
MLNAAPPLARREHEQKAIRQPMNAKAVRFPRRTPGVVAAQSLTTDFVARGFSFASRIKPTAPNVSVCLNEAGGGVTVSQEEGPNINKQTNE